jgi:hypothetical protein
MSPLALCKDCPTEFTCVEEGCELARRAGPQVYTLNERQWEHFMHTMQNPKPPTPAMIEAARKMKEWAERPGKLEYESWSASSADINGITK